MVEFIENSVPQSMALTAVAVGATGCDSDLRCGQLQRALSDCSSSLPGAQRRGTTRTAAGLTNGIGLVAGTGSVAVGRDTEGAAVYVGRLGLVLR